MTTKFNKIADQRDNFHDRIQRRQQGRQTRKTAEVITDLQRKEKDANVELKKILDKVKRLETKLANL